MKRLDWTSTNIHSHPCVDMYSSTGSPWYGKHEEHSQSYLPCYHFYSPFTTQALAICVLDNLTQFSPGKSCLEFLLLSQPTVVSVLLSHSRGRQRAEPTLEGLAASSGRQSRCFFRMQPYLHIWLTSCSPSLFCTAGNGSAPRTRPLPNQARRQMPHQDSKAVEPTYSSALPMAHAALSAERKCKVKAKWEFKKTALHMSSGTFMFYCPTFVSLPFCLTE